eukprot:518270-Hanusia_phi.AAC.1
MYEGEFAGRYAEGGWDGFLLLFDDLGKQASKDTFDSYLPVSHVGVEVAVGWLVVYGRVSSSMNTTENASNPLSSCTLGIRKAFSSYVSGLGDIFVIKYGTDGRKIWATAISTCGDNDPLGLAIDRFGGIYLLGQSSPDVSRAVPMGF